MRVNVADLKLEAGSHKTVPTAISLEPMEMGGQSVVFDQPFTGEAEIWNAGDRMLVRAKLSGEAVLECSRCLGSYRMPVRLSFEEEFLEGEPREDVELEAVEQRTVSFFEGDEIDLTEALQDNVLLELPMKPLCSKDCKGLCQTCGKNLNEGPCECQETRSVDPRLAKLKDLLQKPDHNA
ncbi:MAG TPA: DUF177 domain-containing protein [Symbiobacteriaceae bacterium]|jgi:uncharacterized protein